jgi:proteasome lid subunit RPN8/RPN11
LERLRLLRNRDELPELSCSVDPRQREKLWREERSRGLMLLAEFHSHTAGPALPSRADCAARGRLLVIYSDVYDELRAWRIRRSYPQTLRSERGLRIVPQRSGR